LATKRTFTLAAIVLLAGLVCAGNASAWEVEYNASTGVLPTKASPPWLLFGYNVPTPTIVDGALRIQHDTAGGYLEYSREGYAIAAGVPVTMEVRMRAATSSSTVQYISIQTRSAGAVLEIYTDHLWAPDWGGQGPVTFYGDFTTFRTIRLAYDGGTRVYAWVDNQLALSWGLSGSAGQDGVNFSSYSAAASSGSYWQYVAYSKEFLPVPEPAALTALATLSLLTGAGLVRKRKRGE